MCVRSPHGCEFAVYECVVFVQLAWWVCVCPWGPVGVYVAVYVRCVGLPCGGSLSWCVGSRLDRGGV